MAPEQWLMGIQHPLFKSGEKRDPLNYRGIMLLNVTSKLYEAILEKRLDKWVEKKKIIKEEQGGFRKNRGCPDQIFTLSSILDKRKRKKTFCSYIDLKKAFDSIWRKGLWVKIWNMGIKGKFWRVLKDFYRKTSVTIRINGKFTKEFQSVKGVKQGGVLSPILFSLFINEMITEIKKSSLGTKLKDTLIAILFYADDIVLIAEKEHDLQKMLDIVSEYCYKWRCRINNKKSQVVIYSNKRTKPETRKWILNKNSIEQVNSYKYLGIEMERKRNWNIYKVKILKKAKRAAGFLKWISRANPFLKTKTLQKIWFGLGRSRLEYAAEMFESTDN